MKPKSITWTVYSHYFIFNTVCFVTWGPGGIIHHFLRLTIFTNVSLVNMYTRYPVLLKYLVNTFSTIWQLRTTKCNVILPRESYYLGRTVVGHGFILIPFDTLILPFALLFSANVVIWHEKHFLEQMKIKWIWLSKILIHLIKKMFRGFGFFFFSSKKMIS